MAESKDCGCRVVADPGEALPATGTINYCPLHAAAPALVEALEKARRALDLHGQLRDLAGQQHATLDPWTVYLAEREAVPSINAALAAARGEEESR